MTFQKGNIPWNKGTKKAEEKSELFENNAPIDVDLDNPSQQPIEYAPEPNEAKREGFFSRLFGFFK